MQLFDSQKEALTTLERDGRGFFSIGVGGGKTLLGLLAHRALGVDPQDVLVLTKNDLISEAEEEFHKFKDELELDELDYKSYFWLSRNERYFWEVKPKLIVADECHKLKNKSAKRTAYFLQYMKDYPEARFVPMSGSISSKSILEYAHLMKLALREYYPLPDPSSRFGWSRLQAIARVIDSRPREQPTKSDFRRVAHMLNKRPDETYEEAYYRILRSAKGVYMMEGAAYEGPIDVEYYYYELPDKLKNDIARVKNTAQLPDEEWVTGQTDLAQKVRQLPLGFYYRDIELDCHTPEWRAARREKDQLIGEIKRREKRKKYGILTASGIENALRKGDFSDPRWERWKPFADVPPPRRETVPLNAAPLAQTVIFALELAESEGQNVLLWYQSRAIRKMLRKALDTGCIGPYTLNRQGVSDFRLDSARLVVAEKGEAPPREIDDGPIVSAVSIPSHGTGLNLQHDYAINVVLEPPSSGGIWEQFLGRTHRPGQEEEVICYTNGVTPVFRAMLRKGRKDAEYVYKTLKQMQKLKQADKKR